MGDTRRTMERLRSETRDAHQATERTGIGKAMSHATLTRLQYAGLLVGYRRILAAIEGAFVRSRDPRAREIFHDEMSKVARIDADLAIPELAGVRPPLVDDGLASLEAAIADSAEIDDVAALVGYLYVMEGAGLGAAMLLPKLVRALSLTPESMRYFVGYGPNVLDHWRSFSGCVDRLVTDEPEQLRAIEAARVTFCAVGDFFTELSAATVESAVLHRVA